MTPTEERQHRDAWMQLTKAGFSQQEQAQIRTLGISLFQEMQRMGIDAKNGARMFAGVMAFGATAICAVAELSRLGLLPQQHAGSVDLSEDEDEALRR